MSRIKVYNVESNPNFKAKLTDTHSTLSVLLYPNFNPKKNF